MPRLARTALAATFLTAVSTQAFAQDLVIWWNKGYYPEEDERFEEIVQAYEGETGQDVELNFFVTEDLPPKVLAALEASEPPDLAMGHLFDFSYTSRWAHEGALVDVTDVIEKIGKDKFEDVALESVYLFNSETGERAYYAFPTQQQTAHIHYWKPLLEQAGFRHEDIPLTWNEFWDFWCEEVQPAAREATGNRRLYGVGQPMSSAASDTIFHFMHFLNAYGGRILSDEGEVVLGEPENREALIAALADYTSSYTEGCTPPGAVNWQDPDNNVNFLNQVTMMTPNPTLSIPASQFNTNPEAYQNEIVTMEWPDAPGGKPITYMTAIKTAVIFEDAEHPDNAKQFMEYLLQPEVIGPYIEGSLGRWYPVMPEAQQREFWTETDDPHRPTLVRQYTERDTRPFPMVYNWRYAQAQAENVIGQGVGRIVLEGSSVEDAADWIINRTKEIVEVSG